LFSQQNVLIGLNGEPLICDFGVSKIIDDQGFTTRFTGTPSFMAPELFVDLVDQSALGEDAVEDVPSFSAKVTKETDVFAYGLVSLQVCCCYIRTSFPFLLYVFFKSYFPCSQILTGKSPLIHQIIANKIQVQLRRERYDLRRTMDDRLWNLFNQCCDIDPRKRPVMDEVTQCIRNIHTFGQII
jgi:serine/threonine protein kinase